MLIRYFCPIDDTELGRMARHYADAMVRAEMTVRLVATKTMSHDPTARWSRLQALFLTPLEMEFVNVVCGEPEDWRRLWTSRRRNILIASSPPSPEVEARPLKGVVYDRVIVPTSEIGIAWEQSFGITVDVIPPSWSSALRAALLNTKE